MDVLEQITQGAKYQLDIFNGLVKIEGRILSPSECEAAGLVSAMIAGEVFKQRKDAEIKHAQAMAEKVQQGEQDPDVILALLNTIKPETLEKLASREEEIVKKSVLRCSKDNGVTWEHLTLVDAVDQQDAKRNRLWIGMIYPEDRKNIVERALNGHKEAAERLKNFRA